jgi:hypothetical protein
LPASKVNRTTAAEHTPVASTDPRPEAKRFGFRIRRKIGMYQDLPSGTLGI